MAWAATWPRAVTVVASVATMVVTGAPRGVPARATTATLAGGYSTYSTATGSECSVDGKAVPCNSLTESSTTCHLDGRAVSCDSLLDDPSGAGRAPAPTARSAKPSPQAPAAVVTTTAVPVPTQAAPAADPGQPLQAGGQPAATVGGRGTDAWGRPVVWGATVLLIAAVGALGIVWRARRLFSL